LRRPAGAVALALNKPVRGAEGASGAVTAEIGEGVLCATVCVDAPAGAAAAAIGVYRDGLPAADVLIALPDAPADAGVRTAPRTVRRVPLVVRTVRTGPQEVATVEAQGIGRGAVSASEPAGPVRRDTLVLPGAFPLRELPLPAQLRGLTGTHGSRRPGEGGDLRDVHLFHSGDRLRRIDWRVTARRSPDLHELYVRGEHALAEASAVLVVDSRDEVGPDPRTWAGSEPTRLADPTSLDVARRAAASVARAFLAGGDRVGLDDLGVLRRPLAPGGGRGQLDRIVHALALTRPEGASRHRVRSPRLPSGALVVVFSTFLDDEAADAAVGWRRIGHRVIAVDVLPRLRTAHLPERALIAARLVLLAREDRLADLRDLGVEVITWRDDPTTELAAASRADRRRPGAGVPR
ncbi:MAG: DUF58 domain-containing protein, partial [Micrococcales bacterium]|nr:DUF58 domain-containing protein [Micrococcales bacterium]